MTGAKRGVAPCGHPGSFVTANFVTCDRRCEMPGAVPERVEPEKTKPLCRSCGSDRMKVYVPEAFVGCFKCDACGDITW